MATQHTIAVVEDDIWMRQALERLLKASGYQTSLFDSAEKFLLSGEAQSSTCLILDIHLPGMTGFELSENLRAKHVRTPIIFITAYDDDDFEAKIKELDCVGHFNKPFSSEALLSTIQGVVEAKVHIV